jgi:hypothetical protein
VLWEIATSAFSDGPLLWPIFLLLSLETVGDHCFLACRHLSSVTFEPRSTLLRSENLAFSGCSSLATIRFHARLADLDGRSLSGTNLNHIYIEDTSAFLHADGRSVFDFAGTSLKLYFGSDSHVIIDQDVECLCDGCFAASKVQSMRFESGSTICCIGPSAFGGRQTLSSILIPPTVQRPSEW